MSSLYRIAGARILIASVCMLIFSANIAAEASSRDDLAIQGYSPVSYFEKGIAEKGASEYRVEHDGRVYQMTSEAQVQRFREAPESFVPRFAEFCPYSLLHNRKVAIDPTRFKIVDGQLLLFHNSEELDALNAWNRSGDDRDMLRRAEARYELLRFGGRSDNRIQRGADIPYPEELQQRFGSPGEVRE